MRVAHPPNTDNTYPNHVAFSFILSNKRCLKPCLPGGFIALSIRFRFSRFHQPEDN